MKQSIALVVVVSAVIVIIALAAMVTAPAVNDGNDQISRELRKAVDYLVANYSPAVGLIPETPGSSVYWLYSDNYLAAIALDQYGQGNATLLTIATNISATVSRDLALNGTQNEYMALISAPCQFHASHDYTISTAGGVQVKATLNNGSGYLSENQYADIAFVNAVCQYRLGGARQAFDAYGKGSGLYDGYGFRDLPYNQTGQYQTYKLALYVFASEFLREPLNEGILSTLLRMQAPSGGFYTGYDASYSHGDTLTNTETTSLAILALATYQCTNAGSCYL